MSVMITRTKLGQKTPKTPPDPPTNTVLLGQSPICHPSPHPDNQQGCEVMKWLINSHFIVYFGFILACIWPGTGCWRSTADLWETSMVPFIDHAVLTTPCHNDGLQEVNIRARSKRKRSFTYYLLYFSSKSSVSFLSSSLQLTILRDKMVPSGAKSILCGIPFTP